MRPPSGIKSSIGWIRLSQAAGQDPRVKCIAHELFGQRMLEQVNRAISERPARKLPYETLAEQDRLNLEAAGKQTFDDERALRDELVRPARPIGGLEIAIRLQPRVIEVSENFDGH